MSTIDARQWKQVQRVLDELDTLPLPVRRERLAAMRIDDPVVRAEIESLLKAEARQREPGEQNGFLEASPYAAPEPASPASSLAPGTVLGSFRIADRVGRGGMAEVYRARRVGEFDQLVAVKLITNAAQAQIESFQRERRIVAALEHPGIARIIDGGVLDSRPYMVMEFVEGTDLITHAQERDLDLAARLELFRQVCEAVSFAHRHSVIHRDLKPGNIRVTPQGQVKLLDFGVAKLLSADLRSDAFDTATVLTPEFAAPEQLYGDAVSTATDVYALGVVLYYLLAGAPPFETRGQPLHLAIDQLLRSDPAPTSVVAARQARPPVAPKLLKGDLDSIVARAMQRKPADRYADADELWADIARHRSHQPVRARRVEAGYVLGRFMRRHRAVLAAGSISLMAAALALAGLVAAGWLFAPERGVAASQKTIAVLPFKNLGQGADDEAFADGLHEAVVTHLARIQDLRVISRGSVLKYRDGAHRNQDIGRELGVANLVAGTVRRQGGRVRVSAQLVRAGTDEDIWSQAYDRSVDDVFAIQAQIAQEVARSVQANIKPQERAQIESAPTRSLKAYDLYLHATQLDRNSATDAWRLADWFDGVSQLEQAVARDPTFALAYAALAHINVRMYWHGIDSRSERLDRAREAIEAALRLAPDLGEVRFANGMYLYYGLHDLTGAALELERARAQLPGDASVQEFLGYVLRRLGRYDESIAELRHSMELDPLSDRLMSGLTDTLTATRHYAQSEQECARWAAFTAQPDSVRVTASENRFWWKGHLAPYEAALKAAPDSLDELCWISEKRWRVALYRRDFDGAAQSIQACSGDAVGQDAGERAPKSVYAALAAELGGDRQTAVLQYAEARKDLEASLASKPGLTYGRVWLAYAKAFAGERAQAFADVNDALANGEISGDTIVKNQVLRAAADFYAHVGEREPALDALRRSLPVSYGVLVEEIRLDPRWRTLHADPEFLALVAAARARAAVEP